MNKDAAEGKTHVQTPGLRVPSATPPHVPDHQVLRRIGSGGYGEVWLARNVVGTLRAIKVVHRSTFSDDRPYEREFSGIQKYEPISRSHEGLVDVLHVGRDDRTCYFYYVMELADDVSGVPSNRLPGGSSQLSVVSNQSDEARSLNTDHCLLNTYSPKTLSTELKARGRLSVEECLRLAISLTEALGHLHKNGLVHRDIKPSNIIFVEGVPKLADIGLVTETSDAQKRESCKRKITKASAASLIWRSLRNTARSASTSPRSPSRCLTRLSGRSLPNSIVRRWLVRLTGLTSA